MSTAVYFTGWIYACASGLFGATFFMLYELHSRLLTCRSNELRDLWTFKMIGLRCAVGVGAATVLYFFLQTDLLGDGIWPDIGEIGFAPKGQATPWAPVGQAEFRLPNKETASLVVWSFLAGYSQSLVPSILSRTSESDGDTVR